MTPYEVTALGSRGDGLIDVDGEIRFVPGAAPGDIAHIALDGSLERVEAGPNRANPRCSQFERCGGCTMQHLSDETYIDWLSEPIRRALEQQGLEAPILPPVVTPTQSRRRCVLTGSWQGKAFILGFAEERSHALVSLKDCAVLDPKIFKLICPLETLLKTHLHRKRKARVSVTLASNGIDMVLEGADCEDMSFRQDIAAFAQAHPSIIRIIGRDQGLDDILWQTDSPVMRFDGGQVLLPGGAFTQATPQGEAAIVETLLSWIGEPRSILDLFSGIGTFSIPLSNIAKVHAAEGSRPAARALEAVQLKKGRHGISVSHRDLFRRPFSAKDLGAYDCVVLDPARAGAKAQCTELAASSCPQIFFVSCNANSFARDAKILCDGGYKLEAIQPIGQFLWSTHVELVARLSR